MFNAKQTVEIIKKISEKSKKYEVHFLNHVRRDILNQKNKTLSLSNVTNLLKNDPLLGTKLVMGASTARAGGEQAKYGKIIRETLDSCSSDFGDFEKFLKQDNVPQIGWLKFQKLCVEYNKKPNEKINRGLIKDFLKWAKKHPSNNLFIWLEESLKNNGVESTYLELLKIHGIGKKITSFILRDIVWLLKLEKHVPFEHLIYLQPIDTWLKQISFKLWGDLHDKVDEYIVAKRIVERCSKLGVSSVSFNQGAWYFGSQEVKNGKLLKKCMIELIT